MAECAQQMSDSQSRRILLIIAESYKQLADRASERLTNLQASRTRALDEIVEGIRQLDIWKTKPAEKHRVRQAARESRQMVEKDLVAG
jgi:hypothetical protein